MSEVVLQDKIDTINFFTDNKRLLKEAPDFTSYLLDDDVIDYAVGTDSLKNLSDFSIKQLTNPINLIKKNESSIIKTLHTANKLNQYDKNITYSLRESDSLVKFIDDQELIYKSVKEGDKTFLSFLLSCGARVNKPIGLGVTPLQRAAEQGNIEIVKLLLAHKAPVNKENYLGYTALYYAAKSGNLDIVKILSVHKADFSEDDKKLVAHLNNTSTLKSLQNDHSIVHYAAGTGAVNFLDFILGCGAKPNHNHYYNTPMHLAAINGRVRAISILLKHGANINIKNKAGQTPLLCATEQGNVKTIKFLLENKADFNEQDKGSARSHLRNQPNLINSLDNKELLHLAAETRAFNFLTFLVECRVTAQKKTLLGTTPLHQALEAGQIDLVKILLEQGEDFNEKYQNTGLRLDNCPHLLQMLNDNYLAHHAIISGAKNFLRFIIDCGVNVNQKTLLGDTLLHQAVKENQFDIVKFLLEKHADINAKNAQGETPIYLATQEINLQIVKLLLDNRADVNIKNNSGELPLHCASKKGYCNIMRLLLKHGAFVNEKNDSDNLSINPDNKLSTLTELEISLSQLAKIKGQGYSALHFAAKKGRSDVVEILLKNRSKLIVNKKNSTAIIKLLFNNKIKINIKNKKRMTPLHYAAKRNQQAVVKILLKHSSNSRVIRLLSNKVNINEKNIYGKTPLHLAAQSGHTEAVTLVLNRKAKINVSDQQGSTPLHLAVQGGHTAAVERLLKYKANPNKKDSNGFTAQDYAAASGVKDLVNLFSGDQPSGSYTTIMEQADSFIALKTAANSWVDQQSLGSSPLTASGDSCNQPFQAILGNNRLVPAAG